MPSLYVALAANWKDPLMLTVAVGGATDMDVSAGKVAVTRESLFRMNEQDVPALQTAALLVPFEKPANALPAAARALSVTSEFGA